MTARIRAIALAVLVSGLAVAIAWAWDPPHDLDHGIECTTCHTPHAAAGGSITRVAGNSNLCQSCHVAGGRASARALPNVDEALPSPGLPGGTPASGNSHRWDSGPAGHVKADPANTSTGRIQSGGSYAGAYPTTYTITITAPGDAGAAAFSWTSTLGDAGTGVSGSSVLLHHGLTLTFTNGTASPAFKPGERWRLHVRTELNMPANAQIAARMPEGKLMCSTCHDQHTQSRQPFDPNAPAYGGSGTGWTGTGVGRHFQRARNDTNQMCTDCHSVRNVTSATQGSHPVGVAVPGNGFFRSPPTLPLDATARVRCLTCHQPHFGPATDGTLRRLSNTNSLCTECHTLADPATASHLNPTTGALWPGGQYGSTFPTVDASKRGFCTNCHVPHGWPDNTDTTRKFPRLLAERHDAAKDGSDPDSAENLCFTCHDGSPAATNIRAEFQKGTAPTAPGANVFRHPIADSEQVALGGSPARSVECLDCHNPHRATSGNKLAGVTGIDATGAAIGLGTANPRDPAQHEVCFKCHGDSYNAGRPETSNKRLDFQTSNSAFHPVAGPGRNRSVNLQRQLVGFGASPDLGTVTIRCTDCHNNEATRNAQGPAASSTSSPKGPHGSANATIRRANYWTSTSGPTSFTESNFELCYLCHDVNRHTLNEKAPEYEGTASRQAFTNYYDSPGKFASSKGRHNLHRYHLVAKVSTTRATCRECHSDVHSNRTANNTQYNIDGVVHTSPPDGAHTHLVSFGANDQPCCGRAKPEWWLNTTTGERRCYLVCHGTTHNGFAYGPPARDDVHTSQ